MLGAPPRSIPIALLKICTICSGRRLKRRELSDPCAGTTGLLGGIGVARGAIAACAEGAQIGSATRASGGSDGGGARKNRARAAAKDARSPSRVINALIPFMTGSISPQHVR